MSEHTIPCPLCNGVAQEAPISDLVRLQCSACKARGPIRKTADEARAAWNQQVVERLPYIAGQELIIRRTPDWLIAVTDRDHQIAMAIGETQTSRRLDELRRESADWVSTNQQRPQRLNLPKP